MKKIKEKQIIDKINVYFKKMCFIVIEGRIKLIGG